MDTVSAPAQFQQPTHSVRYQQTEPHAGEIEDPLCHNKADRDKEVRSRNEGKDDQRQTKGKNLLVLILSTVTSSALSTINCVTFDPENAIQAQHANGTECDDRQEVTRISNGLNEGDGPHAPVVAYPAGVEEEPGVYEGHVGPVQLPEGGVEG